MTIGVLNFQGAVQDHIPHLYALNCNHLGVTALSDLVKIDALIIPGGESTVMGKFMQEYALTPHIKALAANGLPIWGICAGSILLSSIVDKGPGLLALLNMTIVRNAYGRQKESDFSPIDIPIFELYAYQAPFIRAPKIIETDNNIKTLAWLDNDPVFVRHGNIIATTFHPELTAGHDFHQYLISMI